MRVAPTTIRAVISDVDGTLLTADKTLSGRAQAAVAELRARGIGFTIISSRPPRGLSMLLAPLQLTTPFAACNGGIIAAPDLSVIAEHDIPSGIAGRAIAEMERDHIESWVFAGEHWLVKEDRGPLVELERRTVQFAPTLVDDFTPYLATAVKIVGVSTDHRHLACCEAKLNIAFAGAATVARSQAYYLDITHPLANKGTALGVLAELMGVPASEIAVLGDGRNDLPMFAAAGLSIAMGNAGDEVKAKADLVTAANDEEGFAQAVEQLLLPRLNPRLHGPRP
ncbi:MAG TPA: Cof-type HAD-IIB family hydrolase [Hyphomicrobiaceae bacterium]|jgi:Cof subfamily protein (haloacid dehalogenase superfamily)|nr:Cof-type HAD-IIB family hydrolase [Hyphomicrobiaceae bacterium]